MARNTHLSMFLPSLKNLPENQLAEGYVFRDCTEETSGDYEWVINHSFEDAGHLWKKEILEKEGYQPGNTTIIYYNEQPVATATAICDGRFGQTEGYLHMVGALSEHKGKHLGLEVSLHVLHKMRAKGMTSCRLDTNDFRLPAIISYLKLGFRPVLLNDDYRVRWLEVLEKLGWQDESIADEVRRAAMPLAYNWRFQPEIFGRGEQMGMQLPSYDDSQWAEIHPPLDFDTWIQNKEHFEGYGWYRRSFEGNIFDPEDRTFLEFLGVNHRCKVWLNGTLIADHPFGFLPFRMEISDLLVRDGINTIAVLVDNRCSAQDIPPALCGWRNTGGIVREVRLYAKPQNVITNLKVLGKPMEHGGRLEYTVTLSVPGKKKIPWKMTVSYGDIQIAEISGMAQDQFSGSLQCPDIQLWCPENPVLYRVTVSLDDGESKSVSVGFRSFESKGGKLYLNGQPLKLFGFNLHEDDGTGVGMTQTPVTIRQDLLRMKALGCNFVRLCHYPHALDTYKMCDELGLISWAELPLYWLGSSFEEDDGPQTVIQAKEYLNQMVEELYSFTSIAFWSVSNEAWDQKPWVAEINQQLIQWIKPMIPQGFALHVSDHWREDCVNQRHFKSDDVIAVNGYPNVERSLQSPVTDEVVRRGCEEWQRNLERLHADYPDKPILISEFGYPAVSGAYDQEWSERIQAQVISAEAITLMNAPGVIGMTIWCWADHLWPDRIFSGLGSSPYGVLTRDRKEKEVLQVIKEWSGKFFEKECANKKD